MGVNEQRDEDNKDRGGADEGIDRNETTPVRRGRRSSPRRVARRECSQEHETRCKIATRHREHPQGRVTVWLA